jgi:hypothetical protein
MSLPAALMGSRGAHHRSRGLISDSRALITSAKALISQSRQSIARQSYVRIVCAWCQQTMRWQRSEATVRGQISHSICFTCFAHVFGELDPVNAPSPVSTQVK